MPNDRVSSSANAEDVRRVLGVLDNDKLLDILSLKPSVHDLESASVSLSGDDDVFGAGRPLKGLPGEIAAILSADEDEERD